MIRVLHSRLGDVDAMVMRTISELQLSLKRLDEIALKQRK